jgi:hypothetical protein
MIRDQLIQQIEFSKQFSHPAIIERFVVRGGQEWQPRDRKTNNIVFPSRQKSMCYMNAAHAMMYWKNANNPKLVYVEGFAVRPSLGILIQHAWVGDIETSFCFDPTWNDPTECSYFGVPFTREEMEAEQATTGVYGLLSDGVMANFKMMFRRDPGLREVIKLETGRSF